MFGGSPLNRLSWLRTSPSFLNAIIVSPRTKWLLFKAGNPLVVSKPDPKLIYFTTNEVRPFLGLSPFFGQGNPADGPSAQFSAKYLEAGRHLSASPRVVFLGLHSAVQHALPSHEFHDAELAVANLEGTPYFSMDVGELEWEDEKIDEVVKQTDAAKQGQKLEWLESRTLLASLDPFNGSVFAVARSMVDWNYRTKFCPACGSPTFSLWGGWKIGCTSLLPWADNAGRKPCPSGKGLHNYTHPRTDAVVIMIAIDQTGDKILLGHNARLKGNFYSALAGFIEPGETFEDAVAREMWEEAGVNAWDPRYHSGQPWPYPANMMVGFYARGDSTQPIRTDLDNELADARWFTREEIQAVLRHPTGATLNLELRNTGGPDDPPFRVPASAAIAGMLIKDWAEGKIGFEPEPAPTQKGSL